MTDVTYNEQPSMTGDNSVMHLNTFEENTNNDIRAQTQQPTHQALAKGPVRPRQKSTLRRDRKKEKPLPKR